MPIYEYQCLGCGKHFEILQKMNEPQPSVCPACGGRVEKVLTTPGGILIKGSSSRTSHQGGESTECCSHGSPCENPKRCCEND
jgi:putative FmdB family regulatory protein